MPHPSGRPWIVAHRGASLVRRENTVEAFLEAARLGADAVEMDVRRTADGGLVVHHDHTIPGCDRPIVAMTRSEVAIMAPHVPDLIDALAACEGMWVDLEIKNSPFEPDHDPDDLVLAGVLPLADGGVLITSFNPVTVERAAAAGGCTGWLLPRGVDPLDALTRWPGHEFLLPSVAAMGGVTASAVVESATAAGVEVGVWTVDDPDEIRRLAACGVGMICTNAPDVARSALDDHRYR